MINFVLYSIRHQQTIKMIFLDAADIWIITECTGAFSPERKCFSLKDYLIVSYVGFRVKSVVVSVRFQIQAKFHFIKILSVSIFLDQKEGEQRV